MDENCFTTAMASPLDLNTHIHENEMDEEQEQEEEDDYEDLSLLNSPLSLNNSHMKLQNNNSNNRLSQKTFESPALLHSFEDDDIFQLDDSEIQFNMDSMTASSASSWDHPRVKEAKNITDRLTESYANAAQQNYRLWLSSF